LETIATSIEGIKVEVGGIRRSLVDTKVDLEVLRVNMATKSDLATIRFDMTTKSDLKEGLAAVRSDMATKGDLNEGLAAIRSDMATKQDLKEGLSAIRSDMATKVDLEAFKTEMTEKFDDVLDVINRSFISLEKKMVFRDEFIGVVRRVEVVENKLGIASS